MVFLLIIALIPYYFLKGIVIKETKALTVITTILFGINILIAYHMDGGWFRTVSILYIIYSFSDHLYISAFRKPIMELPFMSKLQIVSEEAIINYSVFKPFLLIPVNAFLLIKKQAMMGMKDEIGVDIKAADGTKIKIKI
jgi:hypothetical protein